jgi:hypothetical protein
MEPAQRQTHRRNEKLEALLAELSSLLGPVETKLLSSFDHPKYPPVFIVGMPRGGTTLLLQLLAQSGRFAYPTNLLSRFYAAPYVGARIQQLLTDPAYNFNDEFADCARPVSFESDLGKTQGILAPNEFWYFWRRFIPNKTLRHLSTEELAQVNEKEFVAELAAIEAAFDKPFVCKGLILQLNLPFLSSLFHKVLFIYVRRHPFYTIQSLLEAREKYFGDRQGWYSIKPPEYDTLREMKPIMQVAGQVYYTIQRIEAGLAQIGAERVLTIDYQSLCQNPAGFWAGLRQKLAGQQYELAGTYAGPAAFTSTNQIRVSAADKETIITAYHHFAGVRLTP